MRTLVAILAFLAGFQQSTIQVDVNLQQVVATVHDKSGKPVDNLEAKDFIVEEEGKPQRVAFFAHETDGPVSIGLLIDKSDSMRIGLPNAASQAQILIEAMMPQDEFMVMQFARSFEVVKEFTTDRSEVSRSIHSTAPASGETYLVESVIKALDKMNSARFPRCALVVFTDGFNTNGYNRQAIQTEIVRRKIPIYAVQVVLDDGMRPGYVGPGQAEPFHPEGAPTGLQPVLDMLARSSGGRSMLSIRGNGKIPPDIKKVDPLAIGLAQGAAEKKKTTAFAQQFAADLRSRYVLGYYPSGRSPAIRSSDVDIKVQTLSKDLTGLLHPVTQTQ
jgi:VWFA-related protein